MDPEKKGRRERSCSEKRLKLQAAGRMQVAYRRLKRVRRGLTQNLWGAKVCAVIAVLYVIFAPELTWISRGLILAAVSLNIYLSLLAIRFIDRRPFIYAGWLTLLHLLEVAGELLHGSHWVGSALWAAWALIIATDAWKLESEAKDYPELYLSKRLQGDHFVHDKKTGGSIRKMRLAEVRRRWFRTWRHRLTWAAATALVSWGSVAGYRFYTARPSPEAALISLQSSWNADDVSAVAAEASTESLRWQLERSLPSLRQRNEWGTRLPQVRGAEWETDESLVGTLRARATFPGKNGRLVLRMLYSNRRWVVTGLRWRRD